MLSFLISNAYAMGNATPSSGGQEMPWYLHPFTMMIVILGIMYVFMIMPQKREQKKHQERLGKLKVGDRVVTSGGVHGIVANVSGDPIKLKIADNVKIDISRSAIVSIQSGGSDEDSNNKKSK